jgi:RNA polymerase sigma-70 factor (ECF subfamily)
MAMEAAMARQSDALRVFAYRMLGSLLEAERLVEQVCSLVSFQSENYDPRDSVRASLYGTIVRICLDVLATQPRRTLPSLRYASADSSERSAAPMDAPSWLEPFPDELCTEFRPESAAGYGARETISLPFIAALQCIPPRERAIFVFCDTMDWHPDQVADVVKISKSEVGNLLDRARGIMVKQYRAEVGRREPPAQPKATALLMQYLHAWETANLDEVMSRLTDEVTLQTPPSPSWYHGNDAVRQYLGSQAFAGEARGRWRLLPRRANGQFAFGTYELDDTGLEYVAHSIQMLTFEEDLVSEIIAFANRALFPAFKLRLRIIAQGRMSLRDNQE